MEPPKNKTTKFPIMKEEQMSMKNVNIESVSGKKYLGANSGGEIIRYFYLSFLRKLKFI